MRHNSLRRQNSSFQKAREARCVVSSVGKAHLRPSGFGAAAFACFAAGCACGLPSRNGKARLRPSGFGAAAFACFAAGCEWLAEPKLAKQAKAGGGGRTRTYEGVSQRIYSPPPLPLGTLPRTCAAGNNTRRRYMVGRQGLVNRISRGHGLSRRYNAS